MTDLKFLPSILIVGGNEKERIQKAQEIFGFRLAEDPDFFRLVLTQDKESIGIEEVRQMQGFLLLKPFAKEKKSVLIQEAEALTVEAQNALLKTLEEPPARSQIILTVRDESLILPTIASRCQIISLSVKSQITLSEKDEKEMTELLENLLRANIPERLSLGETLSAYRGKSEAIAWLDKLTWVVRKILLTTPSSLKYLNILKTIFQTKKMLQANTNVKLALDNFLIEI